MVCTLEKPRSWSWSWSWKLGVGIWGLGLSLETCGFVIEKWLHHRKKMVKSLSYYTVHMVGQCQRQVRYAAMQRPLFMDGATTLTGSAWLLAKWVHWTGFFVNRLISELCYSYRPVTAATSKRAYCIVFENVQLGTLTIFQLSTRTLKISRSMTNRYGRRLNDSRKVGVRTRKWKCIQI